MFDTATYHIGLITTPGSDAWCLIADTIFPVKVMTFDKIAYTVENMCGNKYIVMEHELFPSVIEAEKALIERRKHANSNI